MGSDSASHASIRKAADMLPTIALLAALAMDPHEALIRHTAGALGVDADYAACIAWHESRFDPRATGALGEEGLFQILPSTGRWVAGRWGWRRYDGFDPATNTLMGVWLIRQGYDDWFSTKRLCIKEYPMAKTSRVFQWAQNVHDDDTALERQLAGGLDEFRRLVWQRAGDGEITPAELAEINAGIDVLRAKATKSLDNNRIVASLLCCEAGHLDPQAERTQERLPALRLLGPEPEEDAAA